ncbi:MAG: SDR family NAD(P)-dependent oxidoreductase [Brevinematia bacterium]
MRENITKLISLDRKTSMITGAGSGIGKAIARILAEAGSEIYAVDYNKESLDKLKKEFEENDLKIEVFHCDLSTKDEIDKLWNYIKNKEPDILVNNLGIYQFRDFLDVDKEFLDKTIDINLKSCFWMCQKMINSNLKRKKGGIIVNISSIEAILPFAKGLAHYTASKAGVIAITRALAKEYAGKGFRINAILPGGIVTEGTKKIAAKTILKIDVKMIASGFKFWDRIPAKRIGKPEDVAKVVLALSSDLFSYVHGAIIPIDGGFLST